MKNKYFLSALLVLAIVGGIAIKNAMTSYHYSMPVSKLNPVYKEDVNNIDSAKPNSEINKKEQISTTSKIKKTNNSKSNNKTTNPVLKLTDTNNFQIEDKETSVNIVPDTSINAEQTIESVELNKIQEVNIQAETPKTTKRVNEATTTTSISKTTKRVDEVTTTNSDSKTSLPTLRYDRTTSIYDDDKVTLLRIEYYSNNKLIYYSDVEQFNAVTNSYTEKIYQWDNEKDIEILIRTDIYSNGKLVKSY